MVYFNDGNLHYSQGTFFKVTKILIFIINNILTFKLSFVETQKTLNNFI